MTSSNGNIFPVTGPLWGESTGHRWIPLTKASDAELWYFFDLHLNKRLSKQSRHRWFETLSRSLWSHCNGTWPNDERTHRHIYALTDPNKLSSLLINASGTHDDVIKWKHFPRYWTFVRGIHRSPVNTPHKGQWRGALIFPLNNTRINVWANNREAGDLGRHRAQYDVTVMIRRQAMYMTIAGQRN